jgi:hypothetical protein
MGVLGVFRDSVTLVNRTDRNLNVRYDGEDITIVPGENQGFPKIAVPYAKRQNPLKGSKHPIDPRIFISMVGVKARPNEKQKDDISPIPLDVLAKADGKLELIDRDGEWHGEPQRKVQLLKKTPYTAYEAQMAIDAEFSSGKNVE